LNFIWRYLPLIYSYLPSFAVVNRRYLPLVVANCN
jgi:hypothetical protein